MEIIYSNIQSKGLFYVVCVARTAINSRVVAGSNYEVVDWTDTVVAMPYVVRTTSGANPARCWVVDIVSGSYATSAEAQDWRDVDGKGGIGSMEGVASGRTI